MDYNNNIYIEVCDKSGFLGAILIETETKNPYFASTYIHALDWIESMLYNMNKELISKMDDIPREIFALRLLETISLFCDMQASVPKRTNSTVIIIEKYRGYYFNNPVNHMQTISLDRDEAEMLANKAVCMAYVNLSIKTVEMRNFLARWDIESYSKNRLIDLEDMPKFVAALTKLPTWITNFTFNQIDDLRDTVGKNRHGFRSMLKNDSVVVIK